MVCVVAYSSRNMSLIRWSIKFYSYLDEGHAHGHYGYMRGHAFRLFGHYIPTSHHIDLLLGTIATFAILQVTAGKRDGVLPVWWTGDTTAVKLKLGTGQKYISHISY
ncbi:uncharacterized protein LOC113471609 [Diaphorina citri]|uniref:Uncharacterized protein LOC113471609 n=1 Tax=Diaphorina citri TaxID=121845 RepID=A0A3Q0JE10_DIACI|nr:uncharacterized protein LOC113471609 [Diaphorina citri]